MRLRVIFLLSVAALLMTANVAVIPASAVVPASSVVNPQNQDNGNVSSGPTRIEKMSEVAAYWTPEMMASAQPMPLMEAQGTGTAIAPSEAYPTNLQPGFAPGNAPGQAPAAIPQLAASTQLLSAVTSYYTYPFPYTFSYIGGGLQVQFPQDTNGKLFFTQDGVNYVCSGTVVSDNSAGVNRLVATAGHCVHDGRNGTGTNGGFSYNVLFCPGYWALASTPSPWGCWGASDLWTRNEWYSSQDLRFDHGFIVTTTTSNTGYGTIGTVIGTEGEAWDQTAPQDIWSYGYPAASPYNGNIIVWTTSGVAQIDNPGGGAPYTWGIGSDETGGSSGGAWIILGRWAQAGYVVSHNDYKYTSPAMPLAMFGPYQDSTYWLSLYNQARVDNP